MKRIACEKVLIDDVEYFPMQEPMLYGSGCDACVTARDSDLCQQLTRVIPGLCRGTSAFWFDTKKFALERMRGSFQ